jgi:Ran GTPase-activating protein (RanGAP) involved in mRNA processing and transport
LSFDIRGNTFFAAGAKALAEALSGNQVMTELNVASNNLGQATYCEPDSSGVIALASVIKDMRAMTSLDLSKNDLGPRGAKHIAEAIKVSKCM